MKKQILTFLIIIGLVFLLINADFNNMYLNLKKIPLNIFAFLLTLQIFTIFLLAYQWKNTMLLIDIKRPFFTILKMNLKGNIIDSITPGSKVGGEVARVLYIKEKLNINTQMSVLILILQKMISLFSFILLSIISILYLGNFYRYFNSKKIYYFLLVILILIITVIILILYKPKVIENILKRKKKNKSKISNIIEIYMENISKINKTKLITNLILGLFIWLLYSLKLIILVRVFNKDINTFKLISITYISYLIGIIPVLPGSVGTFEVGMASLLILLGFEYEKAVVVSVIFRIVTFWFEFIFSLCVLTIEKIIYKKIKGGKYA